VDADHKRTIKLTKVFRQKDQGVWLYIADRDDRVKIYPRICRNAERNALWYTVSTSISKFKALSREIVYEDGLGPTELYADHILFTASSIDSVAASLDEWMLTTPIVSV